MFWGASQIATAGNCFDEAGKKTVTNKSCSELGLKAQEKSKRPSDTQDMPEMIELRKLQRLKAKKAKLEQEQQK